MIKDLLTALPWHQATYVFDLHRRNWLSSNDRHDRYDKARRIKYQRQVAAFTARTPERPTFRHAIIYAEICTPRNNYFDPPNAWPTVKSLIDGLVDAGILPDDNSRIVPETAFGRGPTTGRKDLFQIRLTIAEPPEERQTSANPVH